MEYGLAKFLYIVPLKQGLKQRQDNIETPKNKVFIHSSIKTRIETKLDKHSYPTSFLFLYIVPLKQGLKRVQKYVEKIDNDGFYT